MYAHSDESDPGMERGNTARCSPTRTRLKPDRAIGPQASGQVDLQAPVFDSVNAVIHPTQDVASNAPLARRSDCRFCVRRNSCGASPVPRPVMRCRSPIGHPCSVRPLGRRSECLLNSSQDPCVSRKNPHPLGILPKCP